MITIQPSTPTPMYLTASTFADLQAAVAALADSPSVQPNTPVVLESENEIVYIRDGHQDERETTTEHHPLASIEVVSTPGAPRAVVLRGVG